jgi:GTP-binding protein Era
MTPNDQIKSGFAAVIGVPNAGKSSLVNALVKESVSIVTSKPQTTRKRTLGILTKDNEYQIIFVDTPGVIDSEKGLNNYLKKELNSAFSDVDVVICAVAPWEFDSLIKPWAVNIGLGIKGKTVLYIATQSDKLLKSKEQILQRWTEWTGVNPIPLSFTSSKTGDGLPTLTQDIVSHLPVGPLYYDVDTFTPQSMRDLATEIIRKHCFERLHQEIPYGLAVLMRSFEELDHLIKIEADVLVLRETHKGMVIGKSGSLLKAIGTAARLEIESFFDKKVFLKLHVVTKPWIDNRGLMEELGYAD